MPRCSDACGRVGRRLFRQKSLRELAQLETPLSRCLSTAHLLFLGVSHMVGAGIFVLTGTVVKEKAGPAAPLSFLLCSLAFALTCLCYAEFSTLLPRAGGCYTFTYVTLGELPAFVIGWSMVSECVIALAAVAKSFSGTVDALADGAVTNFTAEHLGELPYQQAFDRTWDLIAVGMIALLTAVNVSGALLSQSLGLVLGIIECLALALIGVCCFVFGSASNLTAGGGGLAPFGFSGVLSGAAVAVFAFSGFEGITNAAEEAANPRRSLPRALLGSLVIVGFLYLVVSAGLPYLTPYTDVSIRSPFTTAFNSVEGARWMAPVAASVTILATWATNLIGVFVLPRLLYALGSDGLIFRCFARVTQATRVPIWSLIFGSVLACTLALLFRLDTLSNLVSMATLLAYVGVGVDLFVLKYLIPPEQQDSPEDLCRLRPLAERLLGGSCHFLRRRWMLKLLFATFVVVSCACGVLLNVATNSWWWWLATAASFVSLLKLLLLLCCYQPQQLGDSFQSPLMPLPPLISTFVNVVLLTSLGLLTWIRFFLWTLLGLIIYVISCLTEDDEQQQQHREDYDLMEESKTAVEADEKSPIVHRRMEGDDD